MFTSSRLTTLTCLIRQSTRQFSRTAICRGELSTNLQDYSNAPQFDQVEPLQAPAKDDLDKVYSTKIQNIVSDITKLTILEVADLNALLKKTLNISDSPMMMMGAMPGTISQKEEEDEDSASATKVQTNFTVRIIKFDETKKVPLIKHVKTIMEGMNLVQAKKFVETLPAVVRVDATREEADSLNEALKAVGAECSIE